MKIQTRSLRRKKADPNAPAIQLAIDITGMTLSMAYAKVKAKCFKLQVRRMDEQQSYPSREKDMTRLTVDVDNGIVTKAWVG